ncbi:hypothetical protein BDQ12DRAFT_695377 [Crucibulum laeve]|uniref:Signal recognition particle subunit SRP72 n=1 Tax=Crucibulum laeve TaxID=68775 RepID=A0A5C3MKB2_9AGAR|nr:hypothetical protein BDQ12DRAFT_695377 [Crucibulum laeve]
MTTKSKAAPLTTSKGKASARKATPKQPLPVPERLKRLFTSLCAQVDGGHFSNAIKTCDKILRLSPGDADALQTKLFLLLQTEQYTPALALIDEIETSNKGEHAFERAYSLYRMQHEDEAREVLKELKEGNGEEDRGVVHLEAQLNYREGGYEAAFELYNQLLDTAEPQSEEHTDILTNLQASQHHLEFITSGYLRALDALPTAVSSTLESNPPPAVSSPHAIPSASQVASTSQPQPSEKKPPRKSRIPAGVIPGVTPSPDPERWLKKSERSTFGQGRRKKGGAGGGATQGASVAEPSVSAVGGGGGKSAVKGKKRK